MLNCEPCISNYASFSLVLFILSLSFVFHFSSLKQSFASSHHLHWLHENRKWAIQSICERLLQSVEGLGLEGKPKVRRGPT
jgi:hypothetical protein